MEREIAQYNKGTRAEFLNDALKFYIDYLENKRLEEWKMHKERVEDDNYLETSSKQRDPIA